MQKFRLKLTNWQDDAPALQMIRERVFIEELGIPAHLEWEQDDAKAIHLLALSDEGQPIGTTRLLLNGHLGRMAVLQEWRGRGIGTALLKMSIAQAQTTGLVEVFLYAQLQAISFYQTRGFMTRGEIFEAAGIPHQQMYSKCSEK